MKTMKPETVKVQTDEKKESTTNKDLRDELAVKLADLKDKEIRINGGMNPMLKKLIPPIDEEIRIRERGIEKSEIMLSSSAPINPKFAYENHPRYRAMCDEETKEELDGLKKILEDVKKQKVEVLKSIPELQARINELEKKLDMKITIFKKEGDSK